MEEIYNSLQQTLEKELNSLETNLKSLEPYLREDAMDLKPEDFFKLPDIISEIRLQFMDVERSIKNFSVAESSFTDDHEQHLNQFDKRFQSFRAKFRTLVLKSKQANDKYNQKMLMKRDNDTQLRNRKENKGDHKQKELIKKAHEVTDSLKRSSEILQQEIDKSSTSFRVLSDSSKLLNDTNQAYTFIGNTLDQSKKLLKNLEWNDLLDYIILWAGFMLFSSTVLYVISKRIYLPFGNPISMFIYLLWLPVRLLLYFLVNKQVPSLQEYYKLDLTIPMCPLNPN